MSLNKSRDLVDLDATESAGSLEDDGIDPELGDFVLAPHVYVWRFASIQGHEEEPVTADLQDCGHSPAY